MSNNAKRQPTIAFLLNQLDGKFYIPIWHAIVDAAEERDVNLVIFSGKSIDTDIFNEYRENAVYQYINPEQFDGMICTTGSIALYIGLERFYEFLKPYTNMPIVSLFDELPGMPGILVENQSGIKSMTDHLIEVHRFRKIAFICGPGNSTEANSRLAGYRESLREHGIPFDENLVLPGTFIRFNGENAVDILLDERKIMPQAIVAANDDMALGALDSLKRRGLRVPYDIALTGFDDHEYAKFTLPPISSVGQPVEAITRKALDILLEMLDGKTVEKRYVFPAILKIRQSCGCLVGGEERKQKRLSIDMVADSFTKNLVRSKRSTVKELIDALALKKNADTDYRDEMEMLISSLIKDIKSNNYNGSFIPALNEMISGSFLVREDDADWENALDALADIIAGIKKEEAEGILADKLLHAANTLVRDSKNRREGHKKNIATDLDSELRSLLSALNGIVKIDELMDILGHHLRTVGIKDCWISLYDGTSERTPGTGWTIPEYSRNILTVRDNRIIYAGDVGKPFTTKDIIPGGLAGLDQRFSLVVRVLYSRDLSHGFLVCGLSSRMEGVYIWTHAQVSTCLNTAFLWRKQLAAEAELTMKSKELEETNKKLYELDRIKNDFIANITHDFRSPLTVILNSADLGLRKASDDDPHRQSYKIIVDASYKLKTTIDRMLDLAKMDSQGVMLRVRKTNLGEYLKNLAGYYASAISHTGIRIIPEIPANDIPDFYTDPEKFEQIINNILSNALKFVEPDRGIIRIGLAIDDSLARITITDNGIGIRKDQLENIFGRFQQAEGGRNSVHKGTGIGLAFSRQLAGFLHGTVRAVSEGPGKGSSFIIQLPLGREMYSPEEFATDDERPFDQSNARGEIARFIETEISINPDDGGIATIFSDLNKEKEYDVKKAVILLVDDSRRIIDIERSYLENAGFRNFITARDGKQAIEAVYAYKPDLIICDFNMPVMSGDKLHNELAGNPDFKKIPFIFLSAITDRHLIIERKMKGAVAYLSKPIDPADFLFTVEVHVKNYMEYKETLQAAAVDELTGLNNRRFLIKLLQDKLAVRVLRELSVMFIDIDHFKRVNDTCGHQAGDAVLSKIGCLLQRSLRKYDFAGRYGGEEFIAVLPDTKIGEAVITAEKLRMLIFEQGTVHGDKTIRCTASFGVASLVDDEAQICRELKIDTLQALYDVQNNKTADWVRIEEKKSRIADLLIHYADEALYEAKKTVCLACGFKSVNPIDFEGGSCPKCVSGTLKPGRNQVVRHR